MSIKFSLQRWHYEPQNRRTRKFVARFMETRCLRDTNYLQLKELGLVFLVCLSRPLNRHRQTFTGGLLRLRNEWLPLYTSLCLLPTHFCTMSWWDHLYVIWNSGCLMAAEIEQMLLVWQSFSVSSIVTAYPMCVCVCDVSLTFQQNSINSVFTASSLHFQFILPLIPQ